MRFFDRSSPLAPPPRAEAETADAYVTRVLSVVAKHATPDQVHAMSQELLALPATAPALPSVPEGTFQVIAIDKAESVTPIVYGWGSVVTEAGVPVVDKQGDIIDIFELRGAVHEFIAKSRNVGAMHTTFDHGEIVDSFVLPQAVQRALGFDLGREGWIVGARVTDPAIAKRVKSGELKGFSLGGSGVREAVG